MKPVKISYSARQPHKQFTLSLYLNVDQSHLALLLEIPWCVGVSGAGDAAGLLQSLVEPCDVLLHLLQRRQQGLGLPQQRQTSLSYLRRG